MQKAAAMCTLKGKGCHINILVILVVLWHLGNKIWFTIVKYVFFKFSIAGIPISNSKYNKGYLIISVNCKTNWSFFFLSCKVARKRLYGMAMQKKGWMFDVWQFSLSLSLSLSLSPLSLFLSLSFISYMRDIRQYSIWSLAYKPST